MREVPTLLIQDLHGFLCELQPQLGRLLTARLGRFEPQHAFILWMVRRELEEVYQLYDSKHDRHNAFFSRIYQELNQSLLFDVSVCFTHCIKAPRIYPDNNDVYVRCTERALYIQYNLPRKKFSINNGYRQIPD